MKIEIRQWNGEYALSVDGQKERWFVTADKLSEAIAEAADDMIAATEEGAEEAERIDRSVRAW